MKPDLDSRASKVRRISGLIGIVPSAIFVSLALEGVLVGWWIWLLAGLMLVGGAFQLFEAQVNWCALRAMGFKTPF